MARRTFGGTAADFLTDSRGNVESGGTGTVWTARTGGTQITDLLDANGAPVTTVSALASPEGMVLFSGPDDGTNVVWADFGGGRVKLVADDGLADLDNTGRVPTAQIPDLSGTYLSFTGTAPTDGVTQYQIGRATATAGSKMKIDWLREKSTFKLEDEAGIWPNETYSFAAFSKEFTATSLPTGGPSPVSTLFAFANSNGSTSDVVAITGDAVARASSSVVFGANVIARNASGVNGARLVGLEIDLEPATGTTIAAGSIGLAINAYSIATGAPAIQLGGVGGGTFANGLVVNAVAGAGVAAQAGSSMASLIDASQGTYSSDAIVLGNAQKVRLMGTAATHAKLYNDSSNNVRVVLGSGSLAVRDSGDTSSLFTFDSFGQLTLAALMVGANQVVAARQTGWAAATGTATRTTFATSTVTTAQLAERVKALIDDLTTHGLIGA